MVEVGESIPIEGIVDASVVEVGESIPIEGIVDASVVEVVDDQDHDCHVHDLFVTMKHVFFCLDP
jgi:hypothetical protein